MKLRHLILAFFLALPHALASDLPDLGDVATSDLTPGIENRIAQEIIGEIRRSPSLMDDPELADYLSGLGYRLVAQSPDSRQPFNFFLIRDNTVNAAAFPGGVIIVHTGLLTASQSESEVASVLAHEIAHVTQRHIARSVARQQQVTVPTLAALALAILAARSSPDLASAALATSQAAAIQTQLNFGRDAEREADRVGLQILEQAGFDPRAMPVFFERLQRASRLYENNAPAYLRTHPVTSERIADSQNRVDSLPYRQVPDSPEFHLVRAKLRTLQGNPKELALDFETRLREGKYPHEMALRYALVMAQMRARNFSRAEQELKALTGKFPPHPMVATLAGQVLLAQGKRAAALEHYDRALARFPEHRALAVDYSQTLLDDRRTDAALKAATRQLKNFPEDPRLYRLQAEAYARLGKRLLSHQAQAEAYVRESNVAAAVEQLQLAQKAGDGDFYQSSIVEARLRELRRELAALSAKPQ